MKFVQGWKEVYDREKLMIRFPWIFCIPGVGENHIIDFLWKMERPEGSYGLHTSSSAATSCSPCTPVHLPREPK
jgi:hypothetical protein